MQGRLQRARARGQQDQAREPCDLSAAAVEAALVLTAFFGPLLSVLSRQVLGPLVPLAALLCLPFFIRARRQMWPRWRDHKGLVLLAAAVMVLFGGAVAFSVGPPDRVTARAVTTLCLFASAFVLGCVVRWVDIARLRRVLPALGWGVGISAVLLGLEYGAGQPLTGALATWSGGAPPPLYKLDRAVVVSSVLVWPVAAWALIRGVRFFGVIAGIGGAILLAALTSSQSAPVGLAVGTLVWLFARRYPRVVGRLIRLGSAIAFLTAPFLVVVVDAVVRTETGPFWLKSNALARQLIWNDTVQRVLERPWWGWGLEAGAALLSGAPHPHNGPLQVWLEFGLTGVVVFTLGVMQLLYAVEKKGGRQTGPLMYAAYSAFLLVFSVGYGLWYPWWMGLAVLLGIMLGVAARVEAYFCGALASAPQGSHIPSEREKAGRKAPPTL